MTLIVGLAAAVIVAVVICAAKGISKGVSERSLASAYAVRDFWQTVGWLMLVIGGLLAVTAPFPFPIPAPPAPEFFSALAVALIGLALVSNNSGAPRAAVLRHAEKFRQVRPEDLMQQAHLPERKAIASLEEMANAGLLAKQGGEGVFATYVLPQDKK